MALGLSCCTPGATWSPNELQIASKDLPRALQVPPSGLQVLSGHVFYGVCCASAHLPSKSNLDANVAPNGYQLSSKRRTRGLQGASQAPQDCQQGLQGLPVLPCRASGLLSYCPACSVCPSCSHCPACSACSPCSVCPDSNSCSACSPCPACSSCPALLDCLTC